jgi:hypothetical protein
MTMRPKKRTPEERDADDRRAEAQVRGLRELAAKGRAELATRRREQRPT